jgi:hypothetical protein
MLPGLADFLRRSREALPPDDVGLPATRRRRICERLVIFTARPSSEDRLQLLEVVGTRAFDGG